MVGLGLLAVVVAALLHDLELGVGDVAGPAHGLLGVVRKFWRGRLVELEFLGSRGRWWYCGASRGMEAMLMNVDTKQFSAKLVLHNGETSSFLMLYLLKGE